jgi:hypothetical protein
MARVTWAPSWDAVRAATEAMALVAPKIMTLGADMLVDVCGCGGDAGVCDLGDESSVAGY